jgi:predicted phosphodiesterase
VRPGLSIGRIGSKRTGRKTQKRQRLTKITKTTKSHKVHKERQNISTIFFMLFSVTSVFSVVNRRIRFCVLLSEVLMRVAVISDIHGNAVGLETVLKDMEGRGVDRMVCLGDAIQGGPQPVEVAARLREINCPVVMGNADAWLLTGEETGAEGITPERRRKMNDVRAWMLTKLSNADIAFIEIFQPTIEIPLVDNRALLCFHGSPTSFDDLIFPTMEAAAFEVFLTPYLPHFMTGGHTHLPHIRRIGASDSFFFNPGSVGLAYSHHQPEGTFRLDAWAEYAILTAENGVVSVEFRRVPYDVHTLIGVYRQSGRPHADDMIAQYQRV